MRVDAICVDAGGTKRRHGPLRERAEPGVYIISPRARFRGIPMNSARHGPGMRQCLTGLLAGIRVWRPQSRYRRGSKGARMFAFMRASPTHRVVRQDSASLGAHACPMRAQVGVHG